MTQHTPGPWRIADVYGTRTVLMPDDTIAVRSPQDGTVAYLYKVNHDIDGKTDEANARLIAAAPDMLAALKTIVEGATRGFKGHEQARAAIARAEDDPVVLRFKVPGGTVEIG